MKKYLTNTLLYRRYKRLKALLALWVYGNPSADMIVIGITWTDGKTTTSTLIHHIINTCLGKAAFLGTTWVLIGTEPMRGVTKMTSYDPLQLQRILSQAKKEGCKYAVLEVSSHGLEQKRFEWIRFRGGVLTNITPEHLDYHKTMERYAAAKQKLFKLIQTNTQEHTFAVLPIEDQRWKKRYEDMAFSSKLSYGFTDEAQIYASDLHQDPKHTTFTLHAHDKPYHITTNLVGKFNVSNIMAARGAGTSLGASPEKMVQAIATFERVSGRQEHLHINWVEWYVDYAHTPRGLEVTLEFLQSIKGNGRVMCVFGAPGLRDRAKRPLMAQVVEKNADIFIVTDDDPSSEDRRQIINDITAWVTRKEWDNYWVIPDRRDAIHFIAKLVKPGDVVALTGIGHQDVLYTNYWTIPRDEKEIIREATWMT